MRAHPICEDISVSSTCTRSIVRILLCTTLALCSTLTAVAQYDYDPLYDPGGVWSLWAYCYDWEGELVYDCDIAVNADAYSDSGGHFHNANRPVSLVSEYFNQGFKDVLYDNTGPLGRTIVYFKQPDYGEAEVLWNCPVGYYGGTRCGSHAFGVGYDPIFYVSEKPEWIHVGATGSYGHGSNAYNHWMTCEAAWGIYEDVR